MSHIEEISVAAVRDELGTIRVSARAKIHFGAAVRDLDVTTQIDGTADWYTLGQELDAIWRAVRYEITDQIIRDKDTWVKSLGQR